MTISVIAIKNNQMNGVGEIAEVFGYADFGHDKEFDDWNEFITFLSNHYFDFAERQISLRGLWYDNDWTIISDPELVDTSNDDALAALYVKLGSQVLSFLIETHSGSYDFAKYDKTMQRHFLSVDGMVISNIGAPLPEEKDLNMNEHFFADDMLKLAGRFGIDLEGKKSGTFIVKQFCYNDELKKKLEQFKQNSIQEKMQPAVRKSWWKLW